MKKRRRRSASEVTTVREHFLDAVRREGSVTLTDLITKYGPQVGVRNTPSDKNLVKRQLESLSRKSELDFRREGRDLIARASRPKKVDPQAKPARAPLPERKSVPKAVPETVPEALESATPPEASPDLQALRDYAVQLEEFSRTLHHHIRSLVRMVERASR